MGWNPVSADIAYKYDHGIPLTRAEFDQMFDTANSGFNLLPLDVQQAILANPAQWAKGNMAFNKENNSYLSIGAEGGYNEAAYRNATWDPNQGLILDPNSFLQVHDDEWYENPVAALTLGSAGFGVGGTTGASLATGNTGNIPQTLALDAAGLAAGYGLSGAMAGGAAAGTGAPAGLAEEAAMLGVPSAGASTATVAGTAGGLAAATGLSPEVLRLLGIAGVTGLGMYGADKQADALRDIAAASEARRAPFYNKSLEYLNNPEAYYSGPGQASLNATLRALSAKHGNPIGSPTALAISTEAGMRDWRDAVTGFGNMGLSGEDARMNLQGQATGADANVLNALGYGIGQATNPPTSLEQLLRGMRGGSLSVV